MPNLTNTIVNAAGQPVVGAKVSIELVGVWSADGARETGRAGVWSGFTDVNGVWTAPLPAQSSYEGATYYIVREPWREHTFTIADSPATQRLRDRLMTPVPVASASGIALDDLTDVSTSSATPGMVPTYNGSIWVPATPAGGGGSGDHGQLTAVASVALSGQRAVTRRSDGQLEYASNDTLAHLHAPIWITLGAASAGTFADVLIYGALTEASWSWTPGPLYLGISGLLTQTPPAAPSALFLAQIGFATGATTAVFDRQPSIKL